MNTETKTPVHPTLAALLTRCSEDLYDSTTMLVTADWLQDHDMHPNLEKLLRHIASTHFFEGRDILFTGSRCYGIPKPDSDFDWVLRVNLERDREKDYLTMSDPTDDVAERYKYGGGSDRLDMALRFGPVNLILVSNDLQWQTWYWGTQNLKNRGHKVTRDEAVTCFQRIYAAKRRVHHRMNEAGAY